MQTEESEEAECNDLFIINAWDKSLKDLRVLYGWS